MSKLNKEHIKKLWDMKNVTVKDCLEKVKSEPDLQFLLTAIGLWAVMRFIFAVVVIGNLIYIFLRLSNLIFS